MRTQCCGVMESGQCNDCPLTAPVRPQRQNYLVPDFLRNQENLASEKAEQLKKIKKASYVGAPAIFILKQACQDLSRAFNSYGIYLVGSSLERPDWRDVDVRCILSDEAFTKLFPDAGDGWECNPRWLWINISISERLARMTGLPIDFQFQPQTHANARHKGPRDCLSMYFGKKNVEGEI
jgi:hypothetical protein